MLAFLLSILFFLSNGNQSSIDPDMIEIFHQDVPFDSVISNYLQTKLSHYSKWNYEIISKPNVLNNTQIEFEINQSKEFKLNGQYAYVPIIIKEVNNKISYSLLTLKLELYDTVLIAKKDIKYNDTISANDTEVQIENVTNLKGKILAIENLFNKSSDKSELISLRLIKAKTNIKAGEILHENMFSELPLIKQGEKIQAHFIYGNISISFDVEAREEGFLGNQIRVIDTNNKIYTALVLNKSNVKIIKP